MQMFSRPLQKLVIMPAIIAASFCCLNSVCHSTEPSGPTNTNAQKHQIVIAVLDFRLRSLIPDLETIRPTLTDMLMKDLSRAEGIKIVERVRLDPLLGELDLNESGAVSIESEQKVGKAVSADYVLEGTILSRNDLLLLDYKLARVKTRETVFQGHIEGSQYELATIESGIVNKTLAVLKGENGESALQEKATLKRTNCDSIAVFEFNNNYSKETENLALSIRERLFVDLIADKGICVVERARLDAVFKELKLEMSGAVDPQTAAKIGRLLGARWALYGSLNKAGDGDAQLDARVVNVESGEVLKGSEIKGPLDQFFLLRQRLSEAVLSSLGRELTDSVKRKLKSPQAMQHEEGQVYFKRSEQLGDNALWSGNEKAFTEKVINLKRSIYIDPWFSPAYFALYRTYRSMYRIDDAKRALEALVRRYPEVIIQTKDLSFAYFSLATLYGDEQNYAKAVEYYNRALKVGELGYLANNSNVFLANAYTRIGEYQKAIEIANKLGGAQAASWKPNLAYLYEKTGDFNKALQIYRELPNKGNTIVGGAGPFGELCPQTRIDLLEKVLKDKDHEPMMMLLQAEEYTIQHHYTDTNQFTKFLKDNFDILNTAVPQDRWDGYREARQTTPLLKAIATLENMVHRYPKYAVADDALWTLAECYRQIQDSDHRLQMKDKIASIYEKISLDYPKDSRTPRAIMLAAGYYTDKAKQVELYKKIINNYPNNIHEWYIASVDLARIDFEYLKRKEEGLTLLRDFLSKKDLLDKQSDPLLKLKATEAEHLFNYYSKGPATLEEEVRQYLKNEDYINAGYAFGRPSNRRFEEASWAFAKGVRQFKSPEMKANALFNLSDTYEHLGIWTEAISGYQEVIDKYLDVREDLGKKAQRRITDILREHPITNEEKKQSGIKLQSLAAKYSQYEKQFSAN